MKTLFSVKYNSTWDNENRPLQLSEGNIDRPLSIKWKMQEINYELISDEFNFISRIFAFQDFMMVCYSKNSKDHSFPNNLVIYNLKKEVIRILPPPIPIYWDKISPVYSIGEIKEIDGEKYIAIYIDTDNYFSREQGVIGFIEIRWLTLTNFEYHPTEYTLIKDYGR